MTDEEFKKYVDCTMSMGLDYKMGGISRGTWIANMRTMMKILEEGTPKEEENLNDRDVERVGG